MDRSLLFSGVSAITMLVCAPAAFAQEATAQDAQSGINDIVVTARKTNENLQSVPIAITALSGDALQTKTVQSVTDLQFNVPGLVNFPEPQGGAPSFAIRGTRQQGITGSQGGVAVYLGYVPLISSVPIKNANFDMQSVQVLKGPQGTLFGKNTTGGAIIFTPNAPSDRFEGMATFQYGNWNRKDFTGMVNVPVAEGVGLRVAGRIVARDGWLKNIEPGQRDLNNEKNQSIRVSLRLQPTDTLTNDTVFDYYHQNERANQAGILDATLGLDGALRFGNGKTVRNPAYASFAPCDVLYSDCSAQFAEQNAIGYKKVRRTFPIYVKGDWWGVSNTTTLELGSVTLRNIFGYRDDHLENSEDDDGTTNPALDGFNELKSKQYTNELDIIGKLFNDRLDYTVGLYYSDYKGDQFLNYIAIGDSSTRNPFGVLPPSGAISPNLTDSMYRTKSYAAFGQINYQIDDKLTLTLGARYTHEKLNYALQQFSGTPLTCTTPIYAQTDAAGNVTEDYDAGQCRVFRDTSFNSFIFNGSLNFKVDTRTLIYVNASKGYQAGGFNAQIREPEFHTFSPETVMSFEAGVKKDWFLSGTPLRTNLALFYSKYDNQQRSLNGSYSDNRAWVAVFNAASSTVWGGEIEMNVNPTDRLQLSGFYSYVNAKYDTFTAPIVGGRVPQTTDLSGFPLTSTPKHTLNASAIYTIPVGGNDGGLRLTGSYYYRSGVNTDDLYFLDDTTRIPGYGLVNGRIDLVKTLPFDIGFWMNNVLNKKYVLFKTQQLANYGTARAGYGEPRSYGLQATYRW